MGVREVKALLRRLAKNHGYGEGEEWHDDAVGPHLVDPKLSDFWAGHFGISTEQFRDWREYVGAKLRKGKAHLPAKYRCTGTTKKRTRCKRMEAACDEPRLFFKGYSDRCELHRRNLTDTEQRELFRRLGIKDVEPEMTLQKPAAGLPPNLTQGSSRFQLDVIRNQEISRQPWEHEEEEEAVDPDEVDQNLFYAESRASYLEETEEVDLFLSLKHDLEEIKSKTESNLGRHDTCQITHSRVNQTWTHDVGGKLTRKVYVSKALSIGETSDDLYSRDDGSEMQIELYHTKEDFKKRKMPFRICTIVSGQRMMVYGPRRSGGRRMFVVARTTKLGPCEENHFYVNVEWWS